MLKPINRMLIMKASARAELMLDDKLDASYKNRVQNAKNEFILSEVQSEFQAEAYTYYLANRLSLLELRACLFFNKLSLEKMLFEMISSTPDDQTLPKIRAMTGQKLSEKQFNNMVEFIYEYQSRKTNKESFN